MLCNKSWTSSFLWFKLSFFYVTTFHIIMYLWVSSCFDISTSLFRRLLWFFVFISLSHCCVLKRIIRFQFKTECLIFCCLRFKYGLCIKISCIFKLCLNFPKKVWKNDSLASFSIDLIFKSEEISNLLIVLLKNFINVIIELFYNFRLFEELFLLRFFLLLIDRYHL